MRTATFSILLTLGVATNALPQDGNRSCVAVIIAPEADKLERFAAAELCGYLDKLYGIKTRPTTEVPELAEAILLVGSLKRNPAATKVLGETGWPKVSDQGIVLKRVRLDRSLGDRRGSPNEPTAMVIGGGSLVATMWAVYELVERWGVRYLIDRDVYPPKQLVYNGVVAELFPLVARMVPPGGEVLSFIDYTASRQLRQRDLLQHVPPQETPASLIFTLADDNEGVLPQLATGSLHTLMGELRKNDWSGFYTRYWTVSDQDPTVHYLARASWRDSLTPQQAYADQVEHVCGSDSVEPALKAFALIEKITLGLDQHGLGFAFPVPSMMTRHYPSGGLSAEIRQDQELYRQALGHMEQARHRSRAAGREYIDCFVGRLRFAVRYLDAADAFGATATAEKANHPDKACQHADVAYTAIREALTAYVATVKDHGDLGAVALMNEYCYRPIRDKRNQLRP